MRRCIWHCQWHAVWTRTNLKWAISLTGMSCRLSLLDAGELVHQVEAIELRNRAVLGWAPGYVHPAPRVVELDVEARLGERECDFLGMRCRECREQAFERLVLLALERAHVTDTLLFSEGKQAEIGSFSSGLPFGSFGS